MPEISRATTNCWTRRCRFRATSSSGLLTTYYYKTGVVFPAYLNGHQRHFRLLGGQESARSVTHLGELFVLADRARVLRDPELAASRMRAILNLAGVESSK